MKVRCVWEHNGDDSLLYSDNFIGAFTRGASINAALEKMPDEIAAYQRWRGEPVPGSFSVEIVQEKVSQLDICDADTDVLFETEKGTLSAAEYRELKALALTSAQDFLTLYEAVPDKNGSCLSGRKTFYGRVPRTAAEMYEHTKDVNSYYFGEIGVSADNEKTILESRAHGFAMLETCPDYLQNRVFAGSYGEDWSLRKVLRRFVWHDRIHAKAMYRMAVKIFGSDAIPDIFRFNK